MDLRDLDYFHAILEAGSIVGAAEIVGRTPPALTKAVDRLESDLGVSLLTRTGRGVSPTPAGLFLVKQTRGLGRQLAAVREQVGEVASGRLGQVRVGVVATMAVAFLPEFLGSLSATFPEMTISLAYGMNDALRARLIEGELDILLGIIDRFITPDLSSVRVMEDRVRIVASSRHRLQGHPVELEDILEERWILPEQSVATRQWFDAAFMSRDINPPRASIETNSIAVLETLIANTDCLSFMSEHLTTNAGISGLVMPLLIENFEMRRDFGAIWTKISEAKPAVGLALGHIEDVLRSASQPSAQTTMLRRPGQERG